MKKFIIATLSIGIAFGTMGQKKDKKSDSEKEDKLKIQKHNWYFQAPTADTVGIDINGAYDVLQGKKPQPIIVAVIDGGTEINHPDLANVLWVNSGEIAGNEKDDDNNGYVDDINGWNFIGGKDGQMVGADNMEKVRLYTKYKSLYDGENCSDFGSDANKRAACEYFQNELKSVGEEYNKFKSMAKNVESYYNTLVGMRKRSGLSDPSYKQIKKQFKPETEQEANIKKMLLKVTKKTRYINYENFIKSLNESYQNELKQKNPNFNSREIVGDDYDNPWERNYGNNILEGPNGGHGSHVSGIIAAERGNKIGIEGIADAAKIMTIRVVPDGDERDKDVANGIFYAVNNGAKIINMSFGKAYDWYKPVVDSAVMYARSKGVLLIHAAGNDAKNTDEEANYPNDSIRSTQSFADNWIEVGASGFNPKTLAASFSNYGQKNVDVFAPGYSIWSSTPDSNYSNYNGTSMAAPVTAGVAALVWSYFPDLTYAQIKECIMKSVEPVSQRVAKPGSFQESSASNGKKNSKNSKSSYNTVDFSELCVTGGVINAKKAVEYAKTLSKK